MAMKKTALITAIIVFGLLCKQTTAQVYLKPYVEGGYAMWFSKSKDLSSFYKSYNTVQGIQINSGFKTETGLMMGFKGAAGVRLGFSSGYLDMGFSYSKVDAKQNTAVFRNGDARILDLYCNDIGFDFGFGWGEKATIGFLFNIASQNAFVKTGYRYANGTVSYGNSHSLNGLYNGDRLSLFSGIKLQIPIVRFVFISVDAGWYGTMLPNDKFTFGDIVDHKGTSSILYLPKDYGVTITDPFNIDNDAVNNLKGFRLNINLRFQLDEYDD